MDMKNEKMRSPKVALCQMKVGESVDDNLRVALKYIVKAREHGADIVVLPEMFICPYNNESFIENRMRMDDSRVGILAAAARENGVYLIAGSIPEDDGGSIYNTSLVFNRDGEVIGRHRKVHMFDIDVEGGIRFMESETLTPGNELTLFDTEFGRFGLAICFDIRFVEYFRLLSLEGAKGIFLPAAFNMTTGPAHWELTGRMRAVDNQLFVAMCSPSRVEASSYVAYGHSLIANPWGEVIGSLDEKEGILIEEMDLSLVDSIRNQLPILKGRRTDLYTMEWKREKPGKG